MKTVLEFLKPMSNRSLFEFVKIQDKESSVEIIPAIASFFDSTSVKLFEIFPYSVRDENGKSVVDL